MSFLTMYMKHFLIAAVIATVIASGTAFVYKTQRDSARQDTEKLRTEIQKARAEQVLALAAKDRELRKSVSSIQANHNAVIDTVRSYYEKRAAKSAAAAADSRVAVDILTNRLRVEADDYRRRLSGVYAAASRASEERGDSDPAATRQELEALEEACAVTTADYNFLYDTWMAVCNVKGCE